ncbi:MAG: hypothetical protein ACRD2H_13135 [Terriglobales bacterium]
MENVILDKLCVLLTSGVATEAEVVYLMVELRKLFELRHEKLPIFVNLFCDWSMHSRLDHPRWSKPAMRLMNEKISSHEFRVQLSEVLFKLGLPEPDWVQVLRLLAQIIQDCPLSFKDDDGHEVECKIDPAGSGWGISFRLVCAARSG